MPIIKSAKKRVRVAERATARNASTKRILKTSLKGFRAKATTDTRKVQSAIDTAVKKGILHPNKAARKKRQLAAAAKNAGVKSGLKATHKTTTKPATTKKAPIRKPTAKKPTTKKPTTK